MVDQANVSNNQRFKHMSHRSGNFEFLYNIDNLKLFQDETLRKHCMDRKVKIVI